MIMSGWLMFAVSVFVLGFLGNWFSLVHIRVANSAVLIITVTVIVIVSGRLFVSMSVVIVFVGFAAVYMIGRIGKRHHPQAMAVNQFTSVPCGGNQ